MKKTFSFLGLTLALTLTGFAADSTAKVSDVHLCCKSCVTGVEKAVSTVPGARADVDKDAGTVMLSGADKETVQKAADAMVKAGYYGTSSDVKLSATSGAKNEKVQTLKVKGVHLCC